MINAENCERIILSSIIYSPIILEDVSDKIKRKDFTILFHQYVFDIMLKLQNTEQPIDEENLKAELEKKKVFNEILFVEIMATTPASNLNHYINILKDQNKKIKLKKIADQIAKNIDDEDTDKMLSFLENEIENLYKNDTISAEKNISLFDLLNEKLKPIIQYQTGLNFLDNVLGGGFELGQLVTITGEQESGKTQLVNQILFNVAKGFNCLYFSLEFNKRQLIEYTRNKINKCNLDHERFKNIKVITDEMTTGDIDDIVILIKQNFRKFKTKFVVIDSQMMLYDDDDKLKYSTSEEKISSIFRKLHNLSKKLDICILLIAQSSKEDAKNRKIEIFGSKKASHLTRVMIHINYDRDADAENHNGEREIFIAKNKQNGKIAKVNVYFDKEKLEFKEEVIQISNQEKPKKIRTIELI